MKTRTRHRLLAASLAAAVLVPAAAAEARHGERDLERGMSAWGILAHEAALQGIAAVNEGTRVSGTEGYDDSADYVARKAERAGLTVTRQAFTYRYGDPDAGAFLGDIVQPRLTTWGPGGFERYDAGIVGGVLGGDFGTAINSGGGDVTGRVWAVDLVLPPTSEPSSTSGCEPEDFTGMPAGSIALIQRGTCPFAVKAQNAADAGAAAAILFNEGNPGRTGPVFADVSPNAADPSQLAEIPALTTAFELGSSFANGVTSGQTGTWARVKARWYHGDLETSNVIAETRGGDPDNVIVVGAHLDSVGTGPGINDNGSGSAGILEIAEQLRKAKRLRNKVRFVWFGAEESGLVGSEEYVLSLPPEEQARIGAMLNFDMIGSPNFVRFVYDGDLSDAEDPGEDDLAPGARPGSALIEDLFLDWFAERGLETTPTAFDGRSDYGPFIAAGIPAGGLFTGAEGIKTEEQAAIYGGTAGEPYDPCYHLSCDNLRNLSVRALEQMGDAAAYATYTLARRPKLPRGEPAPAATQRGAAAVGSRFTAATLHGDAAASTR